MKKQILAILSLCIAILFTACSSDAKKEIQFSMKYFSDYESIEYQTTTRLIGEFLSDTEQFDSTAKANYSILKEPFTYLAESYYTNQKGTISSSWMRTKFLESHDTYLSVYQKYGSENSDILWSYNDIAFLHEKIQTFYSNEFSGLVELFSQNADTFRKEADLDAIKYTGSFSAASIKSIYMKYVDSQLSRYYPDFCESSILTVMARTEERIPVTLWLEEETLKPLRFAINLTAAETQSVGMTQISQSQIIYDNFRLNESVILVLPVDLQQKKESPAYIADQISETQAELRAVMDSIDDMEKRDKIYLLIARTGRQNISLTAPEQIEIQGSQTDSAEFVAHIHRLAALSHEELDQLLDTLIAPMR